MVNNQYIYLSLHVNDFLSIGTETDCQLTKATLEKWFKLKSTKDIIHLVIKISCKLDGMLQMSQEHYMNTLLDHFNVGQIRERCVPIAPEAVEAAEQDIKITQCTRSQGTYIVLKLVGKLMYIIVGMQFNIAFCVGLRRRYSAALTSHHLRMAEHTLVYMKHTSKVTLKYHMESGLLFM
jgi:hypothetical protein